MLDNDNDDDDDEEPGEIIDDIDERKQTSLQPFNYATINEDEILSTSNQLICFFFVIKINFCL